MTASHTVGKIYVASMPTATRTSLSTGSDLGISGAAVNDFAGRWVEGEYVDGDGLDDLLIGATYDAEGGIASGAAYLVLGGKSGALNLADADLKLIGEAADDAAGRVVKLGDMNADGTLDMVIGAPGNTGSTYMSGTVYIVSLFKNHGDEDTIPWFQFDRGGDAWAVLADAQRAGRWVTVRSSSCTAPAEA